MTKQLAPVQKQDIIENHYLNSEYRATQEDMGSLYGVSARTIYRVLKEAGIASRRYTRALAAHPSQTVLASEQVPPALGESVPAEIQSYINNCSVKELSTLLQARTAARMVNSSSQYATQHN